MEIDFLLIGQGLAGTALGYRLKQAGNTIRIFDQPANNNSSRVAAGLFNPVTGRNMVKTWKADELFPELLSFYKELEKLTNKSYLLETPIYRPFSTIEEQNEWMGRSADPVFQPYLKHIYTKSQSDSLYDQYGGVQLKNCGWLKVNDLLDGMTSYFEEELVYDYFDEEILYFENGLWNYKNIKAKALIYCNGLRSKKSKFFSYLPFAPVKGEILEVRQDFEPDFIVNRGVFRVHLGNGIHRVGSTYNRDDLSEGPTESAKEELLWRLKELIKPPVREIISHKTGIRPATPDRKPFMGKHPSAESVYIFNGFGAKGVSFIPFFSKVMSDYLINNESIDAEVDIARYFNYI